MSTRRNGRVQTTTMTKQVRCAVYTRKSTDEGLDSGFSSLDAQREACEAYIASQKHEGWTLLPHRYDDGNVSGATMDRPALGRLLADAREGKVDAIVFYRLDRLSRYLPDFARIMEVLDANGCAIVSVTEQLNTSTPSGRLHLNMVMSFAQHEREVISERTRDKMSAARRKGRWTGGYPVLGYDIDPEGGRLHVNEDEATRARAIFDLYLEQGSLLSTVRELRRLGWTSKRWTTRKGAERGGRPFTKATLSYFLTNRIYVGQVAFQGKVYDGE
ncbi:MAG: recombinase family protein, partial [Phycisphaerales bacterium]|nr:recombinase family protein [Phycisphaerales bacterium]